MGTAVEPAQCPDCHSPLPVDYAERRRAALPMGAKGLLAGGIAVSIFLVPAFLYLVGHLVSSLTDGMGLQKKERGLLFGLAYLLSLPFALFPGWLALRLTLTWPRNLPVKCIHCGWSGTCKVKQVKGSDSKMGRGGLQG